MNDDLYETWDAIADRRTAGDLAYRDRLGAFEALTYESVSTVLRDPASFSSRQTTMHPLDPSVANLDPPEHTRLRRVLLGAFSKGAVDALVPSIRRDAETLVACLPTDHAVDLRREYAVPLTIGTIMHLLRVPGSERDRLRAGTEAIEALAAGVPFSPDLGRAVRAVDEYFADLAAARIEAAERGELPRDARDPVASLVWAYLDGILERDEVGRNVTVLFHGGNGTTSTLIANAVRALEDHPGPKRQFLTDPAAGAPAVVEESLRYEGSTHGLFRTATAATTVAGTEIAPGARVFCRFGAASRDPAAFAEPDRFDPWRDWSASPQHLGFGLGAHFCIGAPLARAQIAVALTTLYDRRPGLRLAAPTTDRRLPGLIFRGWQELHVVAGEEATP